MTQSTGRAPPRATRWHLTWNNYPHTAVDRLREFTVRSAKRGSTIPFISYICAVHEVGSSGTPHLQIYMQTTTREYETFVRRVFPDCHVSIERTNPLASIRYVKKTLKMTPEGEYIDCSPVFEFGVPNYQTGPGSSAPQPLPSSAAAGAPTANDAASPESSADMSQQPPVATAAETVRAATSLNMHTNVGDVVIATAAQPVVDNGPLPIDGPLMLRGGVGLDADSTRARNRIRAEQELAAYCELAKRKLWDQIPHAILSTKGHYLRQYAAGAFEPEPAPVDNTEYENLWIWGGVNCGKTFTCNQAFTPMGLYIKDTTTKWFDGLTRKHQVIMFDELNPGPAQLHKALIKTIADKHAIHFEVKGGTLHHRPKHIIVTSNWSIEQCFPDQIDRDALHKRFFQFEWPNYKGCILPEDLRQMAITRQPPPLVPRDIAAQNILAAENQQRRVPSPVPLAPAVAANSEDSNTDSFRFSATSTPSLNFRDESETNATAATATIPLPPPPVQRPAFITEVRNLLTAQPPPTAQPQPTNTWEPLRFSWERTDSQRSVVVSPNTLANEHPCPSLDRDPPECSNPPEDPYETALYSRLYEEHTITDDMDWCCDEVPVPDVDADERNARDAIMISYVAHLYYFYYAFHDIRLFCHHNKVFAPLSMVDKRKRVGWLLDYDYDNGIIRDTMRIIGPPDHFADLDVRAFCQLSCSGRYYLPSLTERRHLHKYCRLRIPSHVRLAAKRAAENAITSDDECPSYYA